MPTIITQDLLRRSLLKINAIAQGELPDPDMYNDALTTLNELLDNWSTETLSVYGQNNIIIPLTVGQSEYTWGIGEQIDSIRPVYIDSAVCVRNGVTTPIDVIPQDRFNLIQVPATAAQLIEKMSYINSHPAGILKVFPTPASGVGDIHAVVKRQLTQIDNLQQVIDLPPGYLRALLYAVAVDLWPDYSNPQTDIGTIKEIATGSKADLQRANSVDVEMDFRDVPTTGRNRDWDWREG